MKFSEYVPDKWLVIKIKNSNETFYKVLAGWSGGYLTGDSWRANSGIASVVLDGDYYLFKGFSGSIYKCHKDLYGAIPIMNFVIRQNSDGIKVMDEKTDFLELDYKPKSNKPSSK